MSTICRWPWLPRQVPQKEVTLTTLAVMEISDEDSLETQGEPRWPKHMGRGTQSQKATIKVSGHRPWPPLPEPQEKQYGCSWGWR